MKYTNCFFLFFSIFTGIQLFSMKDGVEIEIMTEKIIKDIQENTEDTPFTVMDKDFGQLLLR